MPSFYWWRIRHDFPTCVAPDYHVNITPIASPSIASLSAGAGHSHAGHSWQHEQLPGQPLSKPAVPHADVLFPVVYCLAIGASCQFAGRLLPFWLLLLLLVPSFGFGVHYIIFRGETDATDRRTRSNSAGCFSSGGHAHLFMLSARTCDQLPDFVLTEQAAALTQGSCQRRALLAQWLPCWRQFPSWFLPPWSCRDCRTTACKAS